MNKIFYLPTHEYIKVEGNEGFIGVSEFAAKALGTVTYVDMPAEGDEVEAGLDFGAIESRKAASDLFSPVDGEVLEINEELEAHPTLINENPMETWIIKVRISDPAQLEGLMDREAYDRFCEQENH